MARLGTSRVSDVLDYERDIKGKRLVRLRAGVGAGKITGYDTFQKSILTCKS